MSELTSLGTLYVHLLPPLFHPVKCIGGTRAARGTACSKGPERLRSFAIPRCSIPMSLPQLSITHRMQVHELHAPHLHLAGHSQEASDSWDDDPWRRSKHLEAARGSTLIGLGLSSKYNTTQVYRSCLPANLIRA